MALNAKRPTLLLLFFAALAIQAKGADLKVYYEQQKAELAPTFRAPGLGTEISIKLVAGQVRRGILMKLTAGELSLMADNGSTVTYKRTALHETSRPLYFAEDYAHAMALKKTQEYKRQLHVEGLAEQQAGIHDGRISVTARIEKSSDKDVEESDRKNKKTGNTITTTTVTRSYREVQTLKVTISNSATHPDTYSLKWYVYARPAGKGEPSIHDSGTRRVSVDGRSRVQESISPEATVRQQTSTSRTSSNSSHTGDARILESGKENAGWLVVLKYGHEILDAKASSKSYLTEDWLSRL